MFQELGTIIINDGGWSVPTKKMGDGCLCTDGTLSKGKFRPNIIFNTLEDVYYAACGYYTNYGKKYPWWIVGGDKTGWMVTSFDGLTELKHERSMPTVGTTSETVMVPVESQVMEF